MSSDRRWRSTSADTAQPQAVGDTDSVLRSTIPPLLRRGEFRYERRINRGIQLRLVGWAGEASGRDWTVPRPFLQQDERLRRLHASGFRTIGMQTWSVTGKRRGMGQSTPRPQRDAQQEHACEPIRGFHPPPKHGDFAFMSDDALQEQADTHGSVHFAGYPPAKAQAGRGHVKRAVRSFRDPID